MFRSIERTLRVLVLCGGLAGCQAASSESTLEAVPPTAPPSTSTLATSQAPPETAQATPRELSNGWRVTTYYTPVETFHTGRPTTVRGCRRAGCAKAKAELGTYPESFVKAVQIEGHGRITSGPQAGRYLAWSRRVGHFWLDDVARDAANRPLRPWVTAAADRTVLRRGARFVITDCGRNAQAAVCERFRAARWTVVDVFAPGYGGKRHADVYIGEENRGDFKRSPYYTTLDDAVLGLE